jgi:hypothetical protein
MKRIAWITLCAAVLIHLFYSDFGVVRMMPSMASVEGVAVYPPISKGVIKFGLGCIPYVVFALVLALSGKMANATVTRVSLATIIAVVSPLFVVVLTTLLRLPTRLFREEFLPMRPWFQTVVFAVVIVIGVIFSRYRRGLAVQPAAAPDATRR